MYMYMSLIIILSFSPSAANGHVGCVETLLRYLTQPNHIDVVDAQGRFVQYNQWIMVTCILLSTLLQDSSDVSCQQWLHGCCTCTHRPWGPGRQYRQEPLHLSSPQCKYKLTTLHVTRILVYWHMILQYLYLFL